MMRLLRLYSLPEVFDPIDFRSGVNIILGEKWNDDNSPKSKKTNGVGKSLCIETINFCLFSEYSRSRISQIPLNFFPKEVSFRLELSIGSNILTLERTLENPDQPVIYKDSLPNNFLCLEDAKKYIEDLLYEDIPSGIRVPSFRALLSILSRSELSEFRSITNPHDLSLKAPEDLSPHLFLLNLDSSSYFDLKSCMEELNKTKTHITTVQNTLFGKETKSITEVQASLNELEADVLRIDAALERLEGEPAYKSVEKEIIALESDLKNARSKRKATQVEISHIRDLPAPELVNDKEIIFLYNQFKQGLGDIVERSLDEVRNFQNKIYKFQRRIIDERLKSLIKEETQLNSQIKIIDYNLSAKLRLIDREGTLSDLKTNIEIYKEKSEDYHYKKGQLELYGQLSSQQESLNKKKSDFRYSLNTSLENAAEQIHDFESMILDIHEKIQGNREASFRIDLQSDKKKEPLHFDLRIKDDGSHGINRTKVFIYDWALLLSQVSKKRHPGFLIHDGILETDQDTLIRSLSFISEKEKTESDFQYIITLNRDRIEGQESNIDIDISAHRVLSLTKRNQFFRKPYRELAEALTSRKKEKEEDNIDS